MDPVRRFRGTTFFLGCGFAAKYLRGGGNFSVPLQWMLGLRRLGLDAIWLEAMSSTGNACEDAARMENFEAQLAGHGLSGCYALLLGPRGSQAQELERMETRGMSLTELRRRLAGPTVLLNLCNSFRPPLVELFERRILCDLDPAEIAHWMERIEVGQSSHHEFWTIGLNRHEADCRMRPAKVNWRTFPPLVDTRLYQPFPLPSRARFTTVTQWYWNQSIEIDGEYPDLSKKASFEAFADLPSRVPDLDLELAVNLNPGDPEIERLRRLGWRLAVPHRVAATPSAYRDYLAGSLAEFGFCKRIESLMRSGWVSDRSAAYLATGRPVVALDTGAAKHFPSDCGILWVDNVEEAVDATRRVAHEAPLLARKARQTAERFFDAAGVLDRMLT
ncbi:MAG: glycosyltransferase [Verrucomicrobiae bacterium]|nr:glycosyltransferase [Verrucomicrobiae bacterium]